MIMKKYITLAIIAFTLGFTSCSDDDKLPDVKPADRGTVTDNQGNVYDWVRIGDQMWTTSNAKNGISLSEAEYYAGSWWSYVLENDEDIEYFENDYFPVMGNLMTMEDAIDSAPEGWRLPSDEDWQKLERTLGMSNASSKGNRGDGVAYSMITKDSGCELGLDFGGGCFPMKVYGWIEINLDFIGEHGYYWTSTLEPSYETEQPMAYFRRITVNNGKVGRECMRADSYLSVRWVKDVE